MIVWWGWNIVIETLLFAIFFSQVKGSWHSCFRPRGVDIWKINIQGDWNSKRVIYQRLLDQNPTKLHIFPKSSCKIDHVARQPSNQRHDRKLQIEKICYKGPPVLIFYIHFYNQGNITLLWKEKKLYNGTKLRLRCE
jgi:hypothetical protein